MAHYKKLVLKTVDEWLKVRAPRIGGSEVSAIVGLNNFKTPYDLYMLKTGQVEPEPESKIMRFGHYFEDAIANALEGEYGYQIIKNTKGNVIYLSKDYPFAEASPDRLAYLPGTRKTQDNLCIVEIKNTTKNISCDEDIPDYWLCQVQWYMGITGIHKAVICWNHYNDINIKELAFDETFFNYLVENAREFMENVEKGIAPAPITAKDMNAIYPRHTEGKAVDVSEYIAIACEEYKTLTAQKKDIEAEIAKREEAIKLAFNDAESLSYGGLTLATYKASKDAEKFDSKAFVSEHPDLAKKYMKVTPGYRRLNVK